MNPTARPLTLRVENIPPGTSAEDLIKRFYTEDQPYIQVRSLVPAVDSYEKDIQEYTATILFQPPNPALSTPRVLDDEDITVDSDFHGFTPLYQPSEPIAADIIAVTGLAAHAYGSWAHSTRNMWLRDYLPRDVKNARVLCQDRPIVFIGHSLGGLIIKKVLCDINGSVGVYSSRLPVRSIIFLGTPHKGLAIRALETLVQGTPSDDIIRELKAESPTLTDLNDRFRHVVMKIDILTCYEMTPTKTAVKTEDGSWKREGPPEMMVSLDSARQWYPREKLVACNADHSQIAKLKRGENGIYPSIRFAIKQALLSAGDLYSEAKTKQDDITGPASAQSIPLTDPRNAGPSMAGFSSQQAMNKDRSSNTLVMRTAFNQEDEDHQSSQRLDQAILGWQKEVDDQNRGDTSQPLSSSTLARKQSASDRNDPQISITQSSVSTAPNTGTIEASSISSPPGSWNPEPYEPKTLGGTLTPQEPAEYDSDGNTKSVNTSQMVPDHHTILDSCVGAPIAPDEEQRDSKAHAVAGESSLEEDDELTKAIKEGDIERTRALLDLQGSIDARSKSDNGATPLISAVKHKQPHLVSFLLERGASTTASDDDDNTTVHFLAYLVGTGKITPEDPSREAITLALLGYRPPLDVLNKAGKTPLMMAILYENEDLADRYIRHGANVTIPDANGCTALHIVAISGRCVDIIPSLCRVGADINVKSNSGGTPLHWAARASVESSNTIKRLIEAGALIDAPDADGKAPLHWAAEHTRSASVAQLLQLGANVSAQDRSGRAPLHIAAQYCKSSTDVMEHLLRAGADLEQTTATDYTPLHHAVISDNRIGAIHLLEQGANLECRAYDRCTPLHWAARWGRHAMVKLFLERGANPCASESLLRIRGRPRHNIGAGLPGSTRKDIEETLKKAEKAWTSAGKK